MKRHIHIVGSTTDFYENENHQIHGYFSTWKKANTFYLENEKRLTKLVGNGDNPDVYISKVELQ